MGIRIGINKLLIGNRRGGGAVAPVLPQLSTPSISSEVFSPEVINLTWLTVADVASWKLEWSPNGTNTWTQIGGTITAVTLTYSHAGLTAGTKYYYKLTAVGDGTNYSDSEGGTDFNTSAAYLTADILGTNAESFNSGKGFRKKAAAGDGFDRYTTNGARFNETLSNGETLVLKVDDADKAVGLLLSDIASEPPYPLFSNSSNMDYGIYSGYGLTPAYSFGENNAWVAGTQILADGNYLRLVYSGTTIKIDKSTNDRVTWVNYKTSTVEPVGAYKIYLDAYSGGGGFSEMYKISPKYEGALSTNQVWLFGFFGESNSGGAALNSDLSAGELAPRSSVKIWHNTANEYQDLDIETNNLISHAGLTDNAAHGWENGLALKVEDGTLPTPVYLAKCGQGGSLISHWEVADAYYTTMIARMKANINTIVALGKIPRIIFWYSMGINDILAPTDEATYKAAVIALFADLRNKIAPNALIVYPYLMTNADAYNDSIQDIADNDAKTVTFDTTNLTTYPLRDTYHWNSVGMKNMASAMVASTKTYFGI